MEKIKTSLPSIPAFSIPLYLKLSNGDQMLCVRYERLIKYYDEIWVEMCEEHIVGQLEVCKGDEWRFDPKYKNKYVIYRTELDDELRQYLEDIGPFKKSMMYIESSLVSDKFDEKPKKKEDLIIEKRLRDRKKINYKLE
jgi:hypothetical protein